MTSHQYIDRATGEIRDERPFADRWVRLLYSRVREHAPALFRLLTSRCASALLAALNYDLRFGDRLSGQRAFLHRMGFCLDECLHGGGALGSARVVFERRIRYWEGRPMPADEAVVVSPADARAIVGSLATTRLLPVEEKLFSVAELVGPGRPRWRAAFAGGDFALFRLTSDKYHDNHLPVTGRVVNVYAIDGRHHACHLAAVAAQVTPFSKDVRVGRARPLVAAEHREGEVS